MVELRKTSGQKEFAAANFALVEERGAAARDALPTVDAPTLVLTRRDAFMLPIDAADEVAKLLPHGQRRNVTAERHLPGPRRFG